MEIVDIRTAIPQRNTQNEPPRRSLADITTGVVHYDAYHASDVYDPVGRYQDEALWHIEKVWGYDGEGKPLLGYTLMYHYKVARDGRVYRVNDEERFLWHAKGANARSIAVCCDLGDGQEPSEAQVKALQDLMDWFSFERPDMPQLHQADWWGHGELTADGNATECPGKMLPAVQAYRAGARWPQAQRVREFPETGISVQGRFLDYWESLGSRSLPVFGLPISRETIQRLEDGQIYRVGISASSSKDPYKIGTTTETALSQFGDPSISLPTP